VLDYRRLTCEEDYEKMKDVLRSQCRETGHLYPQEHIGNLDFERYGFHDDLTYIYDTSWLIMHREEVVGFITLEGEEFVLGLLGTFKDQVNEVFKAIEEDLCPSFDTLVYDVLDQDTQTQEILHARGYKRSDRFRYAGICRLESLSPVSMLPHGFVIRPSREEDINQRVDLFHLPTGGVGISRARYINLIQAPSFDKNLDFVVTTEGDQIVAYCTFWYDPHSQVAIIEPVACVHAYRKKGITKALINHGLNQLKDLGCKVVYVGTGGQNLPAQKLYESVGFETYGFRYEWEKKL